MPQNVLQIIKYLVAGAWNTFFGIALYTLMILAFGESHYLLLVFLCNIIAITQSFVCYKIFVFKSKGNIFAEYLRVYVTYGIAMLLGLVCMYILVDLIHISAIIANIITTVCTIIITFFMHRDFTFKTNEDTAPDLKD